MFKKYKACIYILILLLILSSSYLGYNYGVYTQDYHHSFFILSSIINYNKGLKLFEEIFLQYGPGQVLFFNFLGYFIDINIVSLSQITSVIYSLNLLILFKIFEKVSTIKLSFTLILLIYLIHPHAIYPWPDYLSGLCISIFFYFFLAGKVQINYYLCSLFLFLAVFFRSTYVIHIIFSIALYSSILFFFKKKNIYKNIFNFFFILLLGFLVFLFYVDTLALWFDQSLGQISTYASETKHNDLYDKITSHIGKNGFIILKIIYYLINSLLNLLNLSKVENIFFVFFIVINVTFLISIFRNRSEINDEEKRLLFISVLGLSGFVQSLMLMETFRNINATMGIVIVGLSILNNHKIKFLLKKHLKFSLSLISIYFILLFFNFPYTKFKKENYSDFDNEYFLNKKLTPEVKNYYSDLKNFICANDHTNFVNISNDYAISYLCVNSGKKFNQTSYLLFLKKFNNKEYKRLFKDYNLNLDELLFTNEKINSKKLELIKIFKSPHTTREWYGGNIYVFKKS
jgi:hypothetical protein